MKKQTQLVRFMVSEVPEGTDSVYISGNCDALGNWKSDNAVELNKFMSESGLIFFVDVELQNDTIFEYKYMREKNWKTVETGYIIEELENRTITTKQDSHRLVEDTIKKFKN